MLFRCDSGRASRTWSNDRSATMPSRWSLIGLVNVQRSTATRALAELARRYLAGHGPADDRDTRQWAELPLRDARAGLSAIASELDQRYDGLVDLHRTETPPLPPPRLLGPFDPLTPRMALAQPRARQCRARRHFQRNHQGNSPHRWTRRRNLENAGRPRRAGPLATPDFEHGLMRFTVSAAAVESYLALDPQLTRDKPDHDAVMRPA